MPKIVSRTTLNYVSFCRLTCRAAFQLEICAHSALKGHAHSIQEPPTSRPSCPRNPRPRKASRNVIKRQRREVEDGEEEEEEASRVRDESSCGAATKQFPRVLSCDKSKPNSKNTTNGQWVRRWWESERVWEGCCLRGQNGRGNVLSVGLCNTSFETHTKHS